MIPNTFLRNKFLLKKPTPSQTIMKLNTKKQEHGKERKRRNGRDMKFELKQTNLLLTNLHNKSLSDTQHITNTQCSSNLYSSPYFMPNLKAITKTNQIPLKNTKHIHIRLISSQHASKYIDNDSYMNMNSPKTRIPKFNSKFKHNPNPYSVITNSELSHKRKQIKQLRCNSENASLRSFSYHINRKYEPHQLNLIRKFLSNKTLISSALKMLIRYKTLSHLMHNYHSFVIIILDTSKKAHHETDNRMTKHDFAQYFKLYKEENYKLFIDDLFLLFEDNSQEGVDIRLVYSVFTLVSNMIEYKDAMSNIMKCWGNNSKLQLASLLYAFSFVLIPQRNKKKKLIDVIKEALTVNVNISVPLLDLDAGIASLQNSSELESIVNQLRIDIDDIDHCLNKEIMKIRKRIMINAHNDVHKMKIEQHLYNEVKIIEKTLHSLSVLHLRNKDTYDG